MWSSQPFLREKLFRWACVLVVVLLALYLLAADYKIVRRDTSLHDDCVVWEPDHSRCSISRKEWETAVYKQFPEPPDEGTGSHKVLVFAAAYVTSGAVLEMGSGFFSTPMLHALCRESGRYLLTTDSDLEWLGKFEQYRSDLHELIHMSKWSDWDNIDISKKWSVIFVDQKPKDRRVVDIRRLANSTELLIAHDTQSSFYGYGSVFQSFRAEYTDRNQRQHTTIVSNMRPDLVQKVARLAEMTYKILKERKYK